MYITDAEITVKMNSSEAWMIAVSLLTNATKEKEHWKTHGYATFLEGARDQINMARTLASFTNPNYVDQQLKSFKDDLEGKK